MKWTSYKQNKTPAKSKKKFVLVIIIIIIALLVSGGIIYTRRLAQERARTEQKIRDEAQIDSSKKDVQTEDKIENSDSKNTNLPTNSTSKTSDQVPISDALSVSISNTSQSNGIVSAAIKITGSDENGTCVFTYSTPGDRPVVQEVTSSNNICQSNIPEVQFSKIGVWNLNVTFYQNNARAEASQNVTIN